MVRQGTQHHTMGMDQTTINRKQNNEEKIEVGRTYTEESCKKISQAITWNPREETKRKAEEDLAK